MTDEELKAIFIEVQKEMIADATLEELVKKARGEDSDKNLDNAQIVNIAFELNKTFTFCVLKKLIHSL